MDYSNPNIQEMADISIQCNDGVVFFSRYVLSRRKVALGTKCPYSKDTMNCLLAFIDPTVTWNFALDTDAMEVISASNRYGIADLTTLVEKNLITYTERMSYDIFYSSMV